jgi:hypothetical protein
MALNQPVHIITDENYPLWNYLFYYLQQAKSRCHILLARAFTVLKFSGAYLGGSKKVIFPFIIEGIIHGWRRSFFGPSHSGVTFTNIL